MMDQFKKAIQANLKLPILYSHLSEINIFEMVQAFFIQELQNYVSDFFVSGFFDVFTLPLFFILWLPYKTIASVEGAGHLVKCLIHARQALYHSLSHTGSLAYLLLNTAFAVISLGLSQVFAPCLNSQYTVIVFYSVP